MYKILINESGVPVLIEMPEKPDDKPFRKTDDLDGFLKLDIEYQRALSAALADKSKHIAFRDVLLVQMYCDSIERGIKFPKAKIELPIGKVYDLPENIGVSFESYKMCEGTGQYEKPYQQFIKCNYCSNGKLAILTPITEATSPSQVLTAEEFWEKIVYTQHVESGDEAYIIEKDDFMKAMQEYSTLQTQQLQNRVKELEGGLSGSIKVGEGTAITVGNYATICPHDGHNCYDSMCGRTTNICNNSHSFSKETILNDGDKDLIKQAHNEAIENAIRILDLLEHGQTDVAGYKRELEKLKK